MSSIRVMPLGGMGNVTQNMFLYQVDQQILIVDCGIGFPDHHMPGADLLIPDISYLHQLLEQGNTIAGMVLSHGHEDHIGALGYILPELPEFPIFAVPFTAAFAQKRLEDKGARGSVTPVHDETHLQISPTFSVEFVQVTHSVPETRHLIIRTPAGTIYHGSDFKLDPHPVDGKVSQLDRIGQLASEGIDLMTIDCLRVESADWTKSESTVGPSIETTMRETKGKYIITLMSSHIHRIQQTIDAADKCGRKITFVGRSVEQNMEIALSLGEAHIPKGMQIDKRDIQNTADDKLCVVIAGSQGQEGSSLVRAVFGEHPVIQIAEHDTVVFSASAIPGNELPYYAAIDELCKNGVHVVYPDILKTLHQSGHASTPEQQELLGLVKPTYVMPIGGADRHRVKFLEFVAEPLGYTKDAVLLPNSGEVLELSASGPKVVESVHLKPRIVDGLGIGDVGPVVLSDRKALSEAGIIVVVVPRVKGQFRPKDIRVISKGFVFMKEADDVIEFITSTTAELLTTFKKKTSDEKLRRSIEHTLSRKLFKIIRREPLVVMVIADTA
ncbi:MAG: ribonuclease J [Pseudomonadales bacterium]|nr:ribonuclease J [Candidatus Woesebacteria bacterium]MCB9801543.1 ribonuclease J [Pseudomonadales bacterium]